VRTFLTHLNYLNLRIRIQYKDQCLLITTRFYRNKEVKIKSMMVITKKKKVKEKKKNNKNTIHICFCKIKITQKLLTTNSLLMNIKMKLMKYLLFLMMLKVGLNSGNKFHKVNIKVMFKI